MATSSREKKVKTGEDKRDKKRSWSIYLYNLGKPSLRSDLKINCT